MFKADGTRRDFPVRKDRIVIGRKNSCGLRIPLPAISRQHCEIVVTGDGVMVKDLGSSNGTYHNSIRVQESELTAGDEVSVGPVVFTVVVNGRPEEIRPVRMMLDGGTQTPTQDGGEDDDRPSEIADLAVDDDADLARELSDELASAGQLATPSVDEPPVAGMEDSDLNLVAVDTGNGAAPSTGAPTTVDLSASSDDSDLDLDVLFGGDDVADAAPDSGRGASSQGAGGSSIFDLDFDDLDKI